MYVHVMYFNKTDFIDVLFRPELLLAGEGMMHCKMRYEQLAMLAAAVHSPIDRNPPRHMHGHMGSDRTARLRQPHQKGQANKTVGTLALTAAGCRIIERSSNEAAATRPRRTPPQTREQITPTTVPPKSLEGSGIRAYVCSHIGTVHVPSPYGGGAR